MRESGKAETRAHTCAAVDVHALRLRAWMQARGVAAEHLVFEASTHTVAEAAAAAGARPEDFVKSIGFLAAGGDLVVAVVLGADRASASRVGAVVGAPARLASPDELLARSGYPAGGTPPFGFHARFLVDERVMERPLVYAGGGSDRALVRVAPAELVRVSGGAVARVRR